MCSMIPPMTTAPVASATASTSSSTASSRNLSIRIGWPGRGRDRVASCSGRARPCRRRSPSRGRRARTTAARPAGSRSTPRPRAPPRPWSRSRSAPAGCPRSHSSLAKRSRSSARSIESGEVPMIRIPGLLQRQRQLQRRLPAVLDDAGDVAAGLLLARDDRRDVLERQRLEVETVDGVVVGRDRFGVAVDHDGLEPLFAQGEGGVTAAVVELDPLADAVRPAAEDHDLLPRRRVRLALVLVGAVQVRRERLELRGAGVDALVGGLDARARAACCGPPPRRRRARSPARGRRCRRA